MNSNDAPDEREQIFRSLKAEADAHRSWSDRIADRMTSLMGSMPFLMINVLWFAVWIIINLGLIPGIEPFDPFPFGLLTMVVSLEAIALAIIVLISQNRSVKIAELREEVDLQVDMQTEREITKLLRLLSAVAEKHGIDVTGD